MIMNDLLICQSRNYGIVIVCQNRVYGRRGLEIFDDFPGQEFLISNRFYPKH